MNRGRDLALVMMSFTIGWTFSAAILTPPFLPFEIVVSIIALAITLYLLYRYW